MEDLKTDIAKYREMLDRFEAMKINIYIDNLFAPRLNDEEDTQLEIDMSRKTNIDPFVGYLLARVNFTIISTSQFDIHVKEKSLVSLKDKFVNILQAMECEDVRTENVGLLLYISSRLYLVHEGKRTYLISYLKSPLFSVSETWDLYFIQRVNRGLSQTQKATRTTFQKTLGILKSPFELIGIGKSEEPSAEKDAMNRKEFHPAVLMEIAQHLVLLNVSPDDSTTILITLFKKYAIESLLMQSVFVVHQKAVSGQFEGRIRMSLAEKQKFDPSHSSKLLFAIKLSSAYLAPLEVLEVSQSNRAAFRQLRRIGWLELLKKNNLSCYSRGVILRRATSETLNKSFEIEDLLENDKCIMTADQTRLIEFDVKRTTRNPGVVDVASSDVAPETDSVQHCVHVHQLRRVPSGNELYGPLLVKSFQHRSRGRPSHGLSQ